MKKNNTIEFLKGYYSEDIIAQACAYAAKRALYTIDNGIYFKQKREGDEQ